MVFESLIHRALVTYLGAYVEDIDPSELKADVWKGDITLANLTLRRGALDRLGLPVNVTSGFLRKFRITLPGYTPAKLASSPVTVEIDGVYIFVEPAHGQKSIDVDVIERQHSSKKQSKLRQSEVLAQRKLEGMVKEHLREQGVDEKDGETDAEKMGFMDKILNTIIRNVQVTIRNVHVRYEDRSSLHAQPFACGVTIAELSAHTTDQKGEESFVSPERNDPFSYKLVQLDSLSVYFNTRAEHMWPRGLTRDQLLTRFSSIPNSDQAHRELFEFVLRPLSMKLRLVLGLDVASCIEKNKPRATLSLAMDSVGVELSQRQVQYVHALSREWRALKSRGEVALAVRQCRSFRPLIPILHKKGARVWWRYAGRCLIHMRRGGRREREERRCFDVKYIREFKKMRDRYIELYKRKFATDYSWLEVLNDQEGEELQRLEDILTFHTILDLRVLTFSRLSKEISKKRLMDVQIKEKRQQQQSWWNFLPSMQAEEQPSADAIRLTEDEQEALNKVLDFQGTHRSFSVPDDYVHTRFTLKVARTSATIRDAHNQELVSCTWSGLVRAELRRAESTVKASLRELQVEDVHTPSPLFPTLVSSPSSSTRDVVSVSVTHTTTAGVHMDVEVSPLVFVCNVPLTLRVVNCFAAPDTTSATSAAARPEDTAQAWLSGGAELLEAVHIQRKLAAARGEETDTTGVRLDVAVRQPTLMIPERCTGDSAGVRVCVAGVKSVALRSCERVQGVADIQQDVSELEAKNGTILVYESFAMEVEEGYVELYASAEDANSRSTSLATLLSPSSLSTRLSLLLDALPTSPASFDDTSPSLSSVTAPRAWLRVELTDVSAHLVPVAVSFLRQLTVRVEEAVEAEEPTASPPPASESAHQIDHFVQPAVAPSSVAAVRLALRVRSVQCRVNSVQDTPALHASLHDLVVHVEQHSNNYQTARVGVGDLRVIDLTQEPESAFAPMLSLRNTPPASPHTPLTLSFTAHAAHIVPSLDVRLPRLLLGWNPDTVYLVFELISMYTRSDQQHQEQVVVDATGGFGLRHPKLSVSVAVAGMTLTLRKDRIRRVLLAVELGLFELQGSIMLDDSYDFTGHVASIRAEDPNQDIHLLREVLAPVDVDVDVDVDGAEEHLLSFGVATFKPGASHPGHDLLLRVRLGCVRFVYLQQQLMELVDYLLQGILGAIVNSLLVAAQEQLRHMSASCQWTKFDIELSNPVLFVPESRRSTQGLSLELGRVVVDNRRTVRGEEPFEELRVMTETTQVYDHQRTCMVPDVGLLATISRPLRSSYHEFPVFHISARLDAISFQVSRAQYQVFMSLLANNVGAPVIREAVEVEVDQEALLHADKTHLVEFQYGGRGQSMLFEFSLPRCGVLLYEERVEEPLLKVEFDAMNASIRSVPDESALLRVVLSKLSAFDQRVQPSAFPYILRPAATPLPVANVIEFERRSPPSGGESQSTLRLFAPCVVVVPDMVNRLVAFFTQADGDDDGSDAPQDTTGSSEAQQPQRQLNESTLDVYLEHASLVFPSDPSRAKCTCLVAAGGVHFSQSPSMLDPPPPSTLDHTTVLSFRLDRLTSWLTVHDPLTPAITAPVLTSPFSLQYSVEQASAAQSTRRHTLEVESMAARVDVWDMQVLREVLEVLARVQLGGNEQQQPPTDHPTATPHQEEECTVRMDGVSVNVLASGIATQSEGDRAERKTLLRLRVFDMDVSIDRSEDGTTTAHCAIVFEGLAREREHLAPLLQPWHWHVDFVQEPLPGAGMQRSVSFGARESLELPLNAAVVRMLWEESVLWGAALRPLPQEDAAAAVLPDVAEAKPDPSTLRLNAAFGGARLCFSDEMGDAVQFVAESLEFASEQQQNGDTNASFRMRSFRVEDVDEALVLVSSSDSHEHELIAIEYAQEQGTAAQVHCTFRGLHVEWLPVSVRRVLQALTSCVPSSHDQQQQHQEQQQLPAPPGTVRKAELVVRVTLTSMRMVLHEARSLLPLARFSVLGSWCRVTMHDSGSVQMEGALGDVHVTELLAGRERRIVRVLPASEAGSADEISLLRFSFDTFLPHEEEYSGLDGLFLLRMASVECVWHQATVSLLSTYALEHVLGVLGADTDTQDTPGADTAMHQDPAKFIKLDVHIVTPVLTIPIDPWTVHSSDRPSVVCHLGELHVSNEMEQDQDGGRSNNILLELTDTTLHCGEQRMLNNGHVRAAVSLPMQPGGDTRMDVDMPLFAFTVDALQYGVLMDTIQHNLLVATIPNLPHHTIDHRPQSPSITPGPPSDSDGGGLMLMKLHLEGVQLDVLKDKDHPLARMQLAPVLMHCQAGADGMEGQLRVESITLDDTRPSALHFTKILCPLRDVLDGAPAQRQPAQSTELSITFRNTPNDSRAEVSLSHFSGFGVAGFLSDALVFLDRDQQAQASDEQQPYSPVRLPSLSGFRGYKLKVELNDAKVLLPEDPTQADSRLLVTSWDLVGENTTGLRGDDVLLSGVTAVVSDLQVYVCRPSTLRTQLGHTPLLSPVNVQWRMSTETRFVHDIPQRTIRRSSGTTTQADVTLSLRQLLLLGKVANSFGVLLSGEDSETTHAKQQQAALQQQVRQFDSFSIDPTPLLPLPTPTPTPSSDPTPGGQRKEWQVLSPVSGVHKGADGRPLPPPGPPPRGSVPGSPVLEDEAEMNIGNVSVTIINDARGSHMPVLEVRLHTPKLLMSGKGGALHFVVDALLDCNSYNPRIVVWEPLLEPCALDARVQYGQTHQEQEEDEKKGDDDTDTDEDTSAPLIVQMSVSGTTAATLKKRHDNVYTPLQAVSSVPVNLNISASFIENVTSTLALLNEGGGGEGVGDRDFSPYYLSNRTGVKLRYMLHGGGGGGGGCGEQGELVTLLDGEDTVLPVQQLHSSSSAKELEFTLSLRLGEGEDEAHERYRRLHRLNVRKIRSNVYTVSRGSSRLKVAVSTRLVNGSKVVAVRSLCQLQNHFAQPVHLRFGHTTLVVPAHSSMCLPLPASEYDTVDVVLANPEVEGAASSQRWSTLRLHDFLQLANQGGRTRFQVLQCRAGDTPDGNAETLICVHSQWHWRQLQHVLAFLPPLVLHNLHNVSAQVQIMYSKTRDLVFAETVPAAGSVQVAWLHAEREAVVRWRMAGFDWCGWQPLGCHQSGIRMRHATLTEEGFQGDERGGMGACSLRTVMRSHTGERPLVWEGEGGDQEALRMAACSIRLFTRYWLVDKTGLGLFFGHRHTPLPAQQAPVTVRLWENQRSVVAGWRKPFLPADPAEWVDTRGRARERNAFVLPREGRWIWRDSWRVVINSDTDRDGWRFASNWDTTFRGKHRAFDCVRKRLWVRTRVIAPRASHQEAASPVSEEISNEHVVNYGGEQPPEEDSIAVRTPMAPWSEEFSLEAATSDGVVSITEGTRGRRLDVSVQFGLSQRGGLTKTVTFTPHITLCSHLPVPLFVTQAMCTERGVEPLVMMPGSRQYWWWPREDAPTLLQLSLDGMSWSGAVPLTSDVRHFSVQVAPRSILRVSLRSQGKGLQLLFRPEPTDHPSYVVRNTCGVPVSFTQVVRGVPDRPKWTSQRAVRVLEHMHCVPFAWDEPSMPRPFKLKLKIHDKWTMVELDEMHSIQKVTPTSSAFHPVYLVLRTAGPSKILHVSTVFPEEEQEQEHTSLQMKLVLPGVGISVVDAVPQEMFYMFLRSTDIFYSTSQLQHQLECSVNAIQVDCHLPQAAYPVALAIPPTAALPAVHVCIKKANNTQSVEYYKYVAVLVQAMRVALEESSVHRLLEFGKVFNSTETLSTEDTVVDADMDMEREGDFMYFDQLLLYPLKMKVSFKATATHQAGIVTDDPLTALIRTVGVTVADVHEAPLKIHGKRMPATYISRSDLVDVLVEHYSHQVLKQGLKRLIGSTKVLGNPIGLMHNISEGVFDFYNEPSKGFVESPSAGFKGIAKGSYSLGRNLVSGLAGSFAGITGAAGRGLTALTGDADYIHARERRHEDKPEDVVDGFLSGLKHLGRGVVSGATGVVSKPIKGAAQGGAEGFVKGVGQGVVGFFAKPLAGLADGFSTFSEGVSRTLPDLNDASQSWGQQPIRPPRMLYGADHEVRVFKRSDASVCQILRAAERDVGYLTSFTANERLYVLSESGILCLKRKPDVARDRPNSFRVHWEADWSHTAFVLSGDRVGVITRGDGREQAQHEYAIRCSSPQSAARVHKALVDTQEARQ